VADVEVPQGIEDAFATERRALTEHLSEDLCLVAGGSFIAIVDAVFVFVLGTGPYQAER